MAASVYEIIHIYTGSTRYALNDGAKAWHKQVILRGLQMHA